MISFFFPGRKERFSPGSLSPFNLPNILCRPCPILLTVRYTKQDWEDPVSHATGEVAEWTDIGWTISSWILESDNPSRVQILALVIVKMELIIFHKDFSKIKWSQCREEQIVSAQWMVSIDDKCIINYSGIKDTVN